MMNKSSKAGSKYRISIAVRGILIFLGMLLLLWPALLNGFPLLFSDSGTYLNNGHTGVVPVDRPIIYSLFVRHITFSQSVWLLPIAQALLFLPLIPLLLNTVFKEQENWKQGMIILIILSLFTGLSIYSSLVMADIFCGIMILAFLILWLGNLRPGITTVLLWMLLILSSIVHLSHLALFIALLGVAVASDLIRIRHQRFRFRIHMKFASAIGLSFLLLFSVNAIFGSGFKLNRTQHIVVIASLMEKGLVEEYFENNPGPDPAGLYNVRDRFPDKAWIFLWNPDSPLYDECHDPARWQDCWTERDEAFGELAGLIMKEPGMRGKLLLQGVKSGFQQLLNFNTGKLMPMAENSVVYPSIEKYYPDDLAAYSNSLQFTEGVSFDETNLIQRIVVWISLLLVLIGFVIIKRMPSWFLPVSLLIIGSLLANALIIGTLSGVDGRYQARIIWLLPLLALLCIREFIPIIIKKRKTNQPETVS